MRLRHLFSLALALLPLAAGAAPLVLQLPQPATRSAAATSAIGDLLVPTGPFAGGAIPGPHVPGQVSRTAWRIGKPVDTVTLIQLLKAEVQAAGFTTVYECRDEDCGGFDFRYALDVLPEPDMHVDLGDYRFLAARRGTDEAVTLLVSRSPIAAFVQISLVGPPPPGPVAPGTGAGGATIAVNPDQPAAPATGRQAGAETPVPTSAQAIGAQLEAKGRMALDDLAFASGKSTLEPGDYPSLDALAAWLVAHPDADVVLVGHTDSVGALTANMALGRARATAVRQALIAKGVPAGQLAAEGVGYLAPRATNLTPEGRAENRRVEVVLTSTQLPSATHKP